LKLRKPFEKGKSVPRKTTLNLVPTTSASPPPCSPPRALGQHGRQLWTTITGAYDIADEGGREILAQACGALDRAEALREAIDEDGEIIRSKSGIKDHPGLKHELANRAFVVRSLQRLGLDVEAIKPVGRPSGWRS
jgi:hypothetical protein